MDLNQILVWVVLATSILGLARLVRARVRIARGWLVVHLLLLGVTLLLLAVTPDKAGLVAGAFWFVLVLIPSLGARYLQQLTIRQDYLSARTVALCLKWLHPADGWREQPELLSALALADKDELDQAVAVLARYKDLNTPFAKTAQILLLRMDNKWEELAEWMSKEAVQPTFLQNPMLFFTWIRSLGETGDINGMLNSFVANEKNLGRIGTTNRNLGWLTVLAFCGRCEQVKQLLDSQFQSYPADVREFWLATSDMAAGHVAAAKERLHSLSGKCSSTTRRAIERRLSYPLADAESTITSETRRILAVQEAESLHEVHFGEQAGRTGSRPYATYGLILLNCIAFAVELVTGGATNGETLYSLGALWVAPGFATEWWRVVTSTFLHFGYLHLVMNMLGLYLLGRFVEYRLGWKRYTLAYLVSGATSMAAVVFIHRLWPQATGMLYVGASGSIMGMVGGTAAILLRGWRQRPSKVLSRRLSSMGVVIAFQVVFDIITPQVSFTAHAAGAVVGFLIVVLMRHQTVETKIGGPPSP